MKESVLSPSARALLDVAKSDGPRVAARAKMWGAVSTAAGLAAAAKGGAVSAGSSAATAASSGKLLVAGALFGSAVTVGIALAVVRIVSGGPFGHESVNRPVAVVEVAPRSAEDPSADDALGGIDPLLDERLASPLIFDTIASAHDGVRFGDRGVPSATYVGAAVPAADVGPAAATSRHVAVASPGPDGRSSTGGASTGSTVAAGANLEAPLMRKASLIAEARGALLRGDPEAALISLDASRRVATRQMQQEELAMRAKTLRALGRFSEAADAEGQLKTRFPDQDLAR